jgi:hypothetical protein
MNNVAYSKEYLDELDDVYRHLFIPNCYKGEERKEIEHGISVLTKNYFYDSDNPKYPYNLKGSENTVYRSGEEIYSYKGLNGGIYWTFTHQNGSDYLVFKKSLYGYSVLDLSTLQDFHFYPAESFPSGETFIWCNGHYNPANNILAVDGCYWACPSGVVLVDFTNPMQDNIQSEQVEFYKDFVKWDGADLVLRDYRKKSEQVDRIIIKSEEYMKWFEL